MADWATADVSVQVDSTHGLVYPPRNFLFLTIGCLVISALLIFISSWVGYGVSVAASVLGGVTLLGDQRRRSDPNYVGLKWFRPTTLVLRYATVIVACIHIINLAIEQSR